MISVRWSPIEVLRHRDFAAYTPAEFAEARRLMADLRLAGALGAVAPAAPDRSASHGRPTCAAPSGARCVRAASRSRAPYLETGTRAAPRRAAARRERLDGAVRRGAFVRFLHAAVVSRTRVEAFALGTRLTRVTRELDVARSRRRDRAPPRVGSSTGRAAPGSATASRVQRRVGRRAAWRGARSS